MNPFASRRRSVVVPAALAVVAALTLAGCSREPEATGGSTGPTSGNDAAAFPVTIPSALGDAVIPSKPERVVTWGWSAQDAVLALGVVPVAIPRQDYGGVDGVLPWDALKIKELGGRTPTLLTGTEAAEVPFEQIAAAKPDVILAPYSGLTQEEFDRLSAVAPVVAYPEQPWALPWQDQLTIIGRALGKSAEAAALRKQTDDYIAALAAKNPAIAGKSFLYAAANQPGTINVYRATDPRVELLTDLGMTIAPSVGKLDAKPAEGTYFYALSNERLGDIDADVLVMYFGNQKEADAFAALPAAQTIPALQAGRFAPIVGESFVMASSAPTALSIPWMLDRYVPKLAEAAAK